MTDPRRHSWPSLAPDSSAVAAAAKTLRSYDVFDTVITRLVGDPSSAFLLLGQALVADGLWPLSAEQFAVARSEAETRARRHAAPREVTLASIYRELARSYNLEATVADQIADREIQIERRLIRAVPATLGELERARGAGDTVGFISDMYLPHAVLREWLASVGALRGREPLWLSSEHGVTKGEGGLFDVVRAAQAEPPKRWIHKGDNLWADIRAPGRRGIEAQHYVECNLTPSETLMEAAAVETCGMASLFAGAARWTRLARPACADPVLNDVAANVAGPVLYAFVLWVLREARRRGLRRIWFMARDGQVMLPVARTIASRLGLDLELGYLYGGRQVVRVASLVAVDDEALEWMMGAAGVMTVQAVLDRVGVSLAAVRHVAASLGLPERDIIGWQRLPELKRFLQHPDVAPLILAEAAARRAVVLDYFRACGLMGDASCAVVDIGWKGNVLRSMVQLIGLEQASRHTFLYFGLYAHPKGCSRVPIAGYLFDVAETGQFGCGSDIPSMTTLMEIFCQADHGQVMHMARSAEGFAPVCRAPEAGPVGSRWQVAAFQSAVARFAETLPIEELPSAAYVDLRALCDRLLRRLVTAPSADEVALLAPIAFVDDQGGSAPQPFAHSYGWAQLREAFRNGEAWPKQGLNWWVAGAVMLTPPLMRWCLRAAAKAGRTRARWRGQSKWH